MYLYNKYKIPIYQLIYISKDVEIFNNNKTFLQQGIILKVWHMECIKEYSKNIYYTQNDIIESLSIIATIWECAELKYWKYQCLFKLEFENSEYICKCVVCHKIYYLEHDCVSIYINEMNKNTKNTKKYVYIYNTTIENKYNCFLIIKNIIKNIQNNKSIFINHDNSVLYNDNSIFNF